MQDSTVTTVRKQAEFEAFLQIIKKGRIENWSVIAEALGVREATISEWKQHPLAQKPITEGIERCITEMERAGKDDWRMWRGKLKMLGVKDKDQQQSEPAQVNVGVFNNPAMAEEASMNKYKGNYGLFNNPTMARKYAIKESIIPSPRPLLAATPVNKPLEQTPSAKPIVDPKLLKQIQEQLLQIERNANRLKEKLEAKQAEIESSTSLSGWY